MAKCLKEKETGKLVRTTNEKAAEMVKTGRFVYSTKGRFKSLLKQKFKNENRSKKQPAPFGSKLEERLKKKYGVEYVQNLDGTKSEINLRPTSAARNTQLQREKRNKKRKNRRK